MRKNGKTRESRALGRQGKRNKRTTKAKIALAGPYNRIVYTLQDNKMRIECITNRKNGFKDITKLILQKARQPQTKETPLTPNQRQDFNHQPTITFSRT